MIRRKFLLWISLGLASAALGYTRLTQLFKKEQKLMANQSSQTFPLDFQWKVFEPFIFCVHHYDRYPAGNKKFGPKGSLEGRQIGNDFHPKDGFRMYHGEVVPGFPVHPHRGFETITLVRKGYVDHSDSIGAAGRYCEGDVQWMTAGSGLQHSEMFPLLRQDEENTLELFQIWLNLPAKSKMVKPHFKMLWSENIPKINLDSGARVTVVAGNWGEVRPPAPPPDSWASQPESDIQIWLIRIMPDTEVQLPTGSDGTLRTVYFFEGSQLQLNDTTVREKTGISASAAEVQVLRNGSSESEVLILQARPIGEPVVQYGPFVMNSEAEIRQTIMDYQRTQFGGWPWSAEEMVHGPEIRRFAKYPDGRIEKPKA